jgi:hypothetical protein
MLKLLLCHHHWQCHSMSLSLPPADQQHSEGVVVFNHRHHTGACGTHTAKLWTPRLFYRPPSSSRERQEMAFVAKTVAGSPITGTACAVAGAGAAALPLRLVYLNSFPVLCSLRRLTPLPRLQLLPKRKRRVQLSPRNQLSCRFLTASQVRSHLGPQRDSAPCLGVEHIPPNRGSNQIYQAYCMQCQQRTKPSL